MNEQFMQMHKKLKTLNWKSVGMAFLCLAVLTAIVSIFLGSPITHKEEILGITYWVRGWVTGKIYLWFLVCILTLIIVMRWKIKGIQKIFQPFLSVLYHECDPQTLLEQAKQAIEYIKGKRGSAAKIMRTQMECIYILALDALGQYEDAVEYLNTDWMSSKKVHDKYLLQIKRNKLVIEGKKEEYLELYKKLPAKFKKIPLGNVQKLRMEERYDEALEILRTVTYHNLYEHVAIANAYAHCFIGLGQKDEAIKYLDFVIENGNTMALKQRAILSREKLVEGGSL